ncbi:MAG: four helix bundle protein [Phycisphaeraceae bacterium]
MAIRSYRDLTVWQKALDYADRTYDVIGRFPSCEQYRLGSRLIRSSTSVVSNIAAGHARNGTREYLHHLSISLGSLAESETQLTLAPRRTFIDQTCYDSMMSQADEISRMLHKLQRTLRSRLNAPSP